MTFEPAGKYLFKAAKTFHMSEQALSGVVCQRAKAVIARYYQVHESHWIPSAFESHTLTIKTPHSAASSALYVEQNNLLEFLKKEDLPAVIKELKIVRK